MNCPVCRKELSLQQIHGAEFYFCSDCRGLWVQMGQLAELAKTISSNELPSAQQFTGDLSSVQSQKGIACSGCGQAMGGCEYAFDSGIMIDRCSGCGAIWLDEAKLLRIKRHLEQSEPMPNEPVVWLGGPGQPGSLVTFIEDTLETKGPGVSLMLGGVAEVLLNFLLD